MTALPGATKPSLRGMLMVVVAMVSVVMELLRSRHLCLSTCPRSVVFEVKTLEQTSHLNLLMPE